MTPMMRMPALRQIHWRPDGPWWRRVWEWCRGEVVYELVEDFDYRTSAVGGVPMTLHVPAGFRFDGASTPRLSWLVGYRPDGRLLIPGLFHDFAYRHGFVIAKTELGTGLKTPDLEKFLCDVMLMRMTREVTGLLAPGAVAFAALTLGGWPSWRANAKYRRACAATGKLQLHGDYTDDHREPEEPAGE